MKYKIIECYCLEGLPERRKVLCWTDSLDNVVDILDALSGDVTDEDFDYNEDILGKEYYSEWNHQYKYIVEGEDKNGNV